jgi:hypothetical protein
MALAVVAVTSHASAASFTPGNLVVAVAQGTGNNTTVNFQEFTPAGSTSGLNNIAISGTGTNAFRISASAGTSGYLSLSSDGTLLTMPGANSSTGGSTNENTLNPRFVALVNNAATVNFTGTYTGTSGEQERSATTLDNTNWYIIDQGGFYNVGTSPWNTTNYLSVRSFGGQVYVCSAKTSNSAVFQIPSINASTFTALPGVAADASTSDFCMISSGSNGTAYDILYVLSNSTGLTKYSLVGGTWVSNGADTNTTVKSGFEMAAVSNGSGGVVFYMVTSAGVSGNSIVKFTDSTGYNSAISDSTPTPLLTSTSGSTVFKGLTFAPVPVTISTTGTLAALNTTQGTASAPTSFSISAVSLTNNITVSAPTGFEISTSSGSGYANSLTLPETGGTVSATTIFVRLAASAPVGTYSGSIACASSGVPTSYVPTASSTVVAGTMPAIAVTGTLSAMSASFGSASTPESFSASGSNLNGNITVTAPTGFELSTTSGSGYASSLTLTPSSGTVPATTIYVRLAATDATGTYSGNITLSSSGATTVNEAIPTSTVTSSAILTGLTSSAGGLTQQVSATTLSYTEYVGSSTTSITFTPTVPNGSTVTVNGQSATTPVNVNTGPNTVSIVVTNGGQNQTYTVNVIRAGAFTPGYLVVTTYGNLAVSPVHTDGQTTLITLAEFASTIAPNSTPVMAFALPSAVAGNNVGLTGEYGSSSEGTIQQTPDGLYLTIGGYSATQALAYTATALAQSPCAQVPRVAAFIDGNTNANTTSVFDDIYNTNNPRCVFSPDDFNLYLSGQGAGASDEGGLYYTQEGTNTTTGGTAPTGIYNVVSTRHILEFNGNLYYSCDQNSDSKGTQTGIFQYTGLPTTSQGSNTGTRLLPAGSGSVNYSPQEFWFANATTLYVADTGLPKAGGTGAGGMQKWVFSGSQWVLQYTLTSPNFVPPDQTASATHGETGLQAMTGTVTDGVAYIYATSYTAGDADPNGLYGVTDTLTATSSSATLTEIAAAPGIQSSGTNPDFNFKGVSFTPVGSPVNPVAASSITANGATLNGSINPNGTDTVAYFAYGTSPSLGSMSTQQDLGSGNSAVPFSFNLGSLQPGTTYYYQVVTVANGLTSTDAIQTFTTAASVPAMPPWGYLVLAPLLLLIGARKIRRTA